MDKIIIANWKMQGSIKKVINDFKIYMYNKLSNNAIFVPPTLYLPIIHQLLIDNNTNLNLGCQDISKYNDRGAYTGEISLEMLLEFGIKYVILGHSERRAMGETSDTILSKLTNCISNQITPILCIGESLGSRNNGTYIEFINQQLDGLKNIKTNQAIYIAYEPIWSIGSGLVPTIQQIEEVLNFIKNYLANICIYNFKLFYGGSVNVSNSKDIISINSLDGLLVGGVSLNTNDFLSIISGTLAL